MIDGPGVHSSTGPSATGTGRCPQWVMLIAGDALTAEPLLTPAEEVELARAVEAGLLAREARLSGRPFLGATVAELLELEELGERARQRYIRANLRLVAKGAAEAAVRTKLPEGDLFQEGCLGLMAAVERFDWRRGFRLSTYATVWIRAYVGTATATLLGAMNLPAGRAMRLRAVRGAEFELAQVLGRTPSPAELAAAVGRSERWVGELLATERPQTLDGLDDGLGCLADRDGFVAVDDRDHPGAELLAHLDGLPRQVVDLRFGFADGQAHSYAEIGRRLRLPVSRIRRAERQALETLRGVCPQSASVHL